MRRLLAGLLIWNRGDLLPFIRSFASVRRFSRTAPTSTSLSMMKLDSPSAQRNKQPIWEVLSTKVLPRLERPTETKKIRVLEVAAGCGVHTEHFALSLSGAFGKGSVSWYPTDPMQDSLTSIQAYIDDNSDALSNVVMPPLPLTLDASGIQEAATKTELLGQTSSSFSLDLILCINMIHISPWEATLGLMKLAGESLSRSGCLYCYGPYKEGGTAVESNINFDASLKSRDPSWGVRDLETVIEAASSAGLDLVERIEMPANNLSLIFQKKK